MTKITSHLLKICGLLVLSPLSIAGAWVPAQGDGYVKVAYSDFSADDFFGTNDDLGEFNGPNFSYYSEHGIAKNLGLFVNVLVSDLEQIDAEGNSTESNGFGDFEVGLRYQWQAKPFVFSTALTAKLPYLYDEDDELPRGNGQEDVELRFLIGKGLNRFGYFGVELGYRVRFEDPSDEIRYLLEYGFNATKNLYFRTKLDGIQSAGNADTSEVVNLSVTPEFDLGRLELTSGWNFGKPNSSKGRWGVEVTYFRDIFGDNALQGDGVQVGITRVY